MIGEIVRFEWRYHTRQITFFAASALFFLFGFALTATGYGPDTVHVNSPYSIAQSIAFLSLPAVFLVAAFCANAVVRDREHQMEEIVFTTAVRKRQYLLGRFTGSLLAAYTAFGLSALGMLVAVFMPWQEAGRIGALHAGWYLYALLVFGVPNLLIVAVVLFGVATLTRSVLASYVGAVFVYVLYFVGALLTNSPLMAASKPAEGNAARLASLLDPFALSAFFEQTRTWTPVVRNVRGFELAGNVLLNRLLWIALAMIGLAIVYRVFAFRVVTERGRAVVTPAAEAHASTPYRPLATAPSAWSAWVSATRIEIRSFLFSRPFLVLLALWISLVATEMIGDLSAGEYGVASYPTWGLLFGAMHAPLSIIAFVVLVYYGAEMTWREKTLRMADMLNATPAPRAMFLLSKWAALSVLVLTLLASGIVTGLALQLAKGFVHLQPALLVFAWTEAVPLVLLAGVIVWICESSPQKYVGMFAAIVFIVCIHRGALIGLEHPLLRFATAPELRYSELNGFGHGLVAFHWFMAYWAALAAALLLRKRWLLVAFAALGAWIFWNTNVRNRYENGEDITKWRAAYERTYEPLAALPQPRVTSVSAAVSLHPEARAYGIRGTYALVNESARAIDRVLVTVRRDARKATVSMPHARLMTRDARFGQYVFALDRPLAPNERTELRFELAYANPGFDADNAELAIAENGSYLMSMLTFPGVGYRSSYEIRDAAERRRRGLPAAKKSDPDAESQHDVFTDQWIDLDLEVSTSRDQIAVAPGTLVREWTEGDRRHFHYRSDAKMRNLFTIASARYAVARAQNVELYYDPRHGVNAARMLRAATDSVKLFGESFAPYPRRTLRIAEVPATQPFGGFAVPGMIALTENRAFLIDARDPRRVDLVSRRTAHEVAHQWWGHLLVPADAEGSSMLVETLTKYCELLLLDRKYGDEQVRMSLAFELDAYLAGRADDTAELPLARADRPYLYYRKGSIVMYAIRDLLGEATLHRALRDFIAEEGGPGHLPTTADLLRHLHAVATPQQGALIDDWTKRITLYDLRMESATARRLPGGRYELRLRITTSNVRPEELQVGVYVGDTLRISRHAMHRGMNELTLVVDGVPDSAGIDPNGYRIDGNRSDNWKSVAMK